MQYSTSSALRGWLCFTLPLVVLGATLAPAVAWPDPAPAFDAAKVLSAYQAESGPAGPLTASPHPF